MKKYILIFVCLCFSTMAVYAQNFVVCNQGKNPVDSINAIGYTEKMDSITAYSTGKDGLLSIKDSRIKLLLLEHKSYSSLLLDLRQEIDDTIMLSAAVNLKEVVVKEKMEEYNYDHISYKISHEAMKKYDNFYLSLNEIPNLMVSPQIGLFYEGSQNVKLLLNGVETTQQELSTVSKEDIYKVNVYNTPPARFVAQGITTVIDVITKSNLSGGNVGVNLNQAVKPLEGNNTMAVYYNYKQSRFSLIYNNSNKHRNKFHQNDIIKYEFDGVEYEKRRDGIDSKQHEDNNSLEVSFQNNRPNSYLYNVKAGVDFNRNNFNGKQNVIDNETSFFANNILNTRYNRFNIANYFEKQLGDNAKYGTILGNVLYQRLKTNYYSGYMEFANADTQSPSIDVNSRYSTDYDAVIGEIQYQFPQRSWGMLFLSLYDNYKYSRYEDVTSPFFQKSNSFGASAMLYGRKDKITYMLTMAVDGKYVSTSSLAKSHNMWMPSPKLNITYQVKNDLRFSFNYKYSGSMPSIAQLSETHQWLDTKLVFHGNSQLKPYKTHDINLRTVYNNKYISGSLSLGFESSPNMICNHYKRTADYMLETIINLDKYTEAYGQLTVTLKPLGNNKWHIWNRIIVGEIRGEGANYDWEGSRFQWMISNTLQFNKWSLEAFYQYPGKVALGQLIMPRGEYWSLSASYRPIEDMSIGVEWALPFGKHFKDSQRTVEEALVLSKTESIINEWANRISVKFSWNFSFGKRKNNATPQFGNINNDTGILTK